MFVQARPLLVGWSIACSVKTVGREEVLFIFLNLLGLLHSFSGLHYMYVYVYVYVFMFMFMFVFMFVFVYIERIGREGGKTRERETNRGQRWRDIDE